MKLRRLSLCSPVQRLLYLVVSLQGVWTTSGRKGKKKGGSDLDFIVVPGDTKPRSSGRNTGSGTSKAGECVSNSISGGRRVPIKQYCTTLLPSWSPINPQEFIWGFNARRFVQGFLLLYYIFIHLICICVARSSWCGVFPFNRNAMARSCSACVWFSLEHWYVTESVLCILYMSLQRHCRHGRTMGGARI